jgi:2-dehydro-3-deoxygluconokinase
MPDLISIGECMIELFSEDPIEQADTFTRSLAGDSFNICVATQKLGTSAGYITRLGDDPFAAYLLNTWNSLGIDTSQIRTVDGFNAVHFVALMPDGNREFVYYRSGSAPTTLEPDDLDPDYIGSAKVFHCSGIAQAISETARATVLKAAQIAKERGLKVSYDPNYRHQLWRPEDLWTAASELLPYVDYFLPNTSDDAPALIGSDDPYRMVEHFREMGVPVVAVTRGEEGAVIGFEDRVVEIPPYSPGGPIDSTAAGDAFNGAFIHGLLNGMSVPESGWLGTITAGLKLRQRGAIGGMPTREEAFGVFDTLRADIQ